MRPHAARNYTGYFNPLPEIVLNRGRQCQQSLRNLYGRQKFYNHIPAQLVKSRVSARLWKTYFKFCVERNPWDKTLSHYFMQKYRSHGQLSLKDYFERKGFCLNHPIYTDQRDQVLVDRVVKFEALNDSLSALFADLNIPFSGVLSVKAKSEYRDNRAPYREMLSDEQRGIVAKVFAKEIAMHGYSF